MKTKINLIIFAVNIVFASFAIDAAELELIWEKEYFCNGMNYPMDTYFEFSTTNPNTILSFNPLYSYKGGNEMLADTTKFYLATIDINTGDFIGGMKIVQSPLSLKPLCTTIYNDTVTFFNWYGITPTTNFPSPFQLRTFKAAISNEGIDIIPAYPDNPSVFIDTSLKGYALSYLIGDWYYNKETGLTNKKLTGATFQVDRINTVDTFYFEQLNKSNLFDDIGIDTTNLHIHAKDVHEIDSNNYLLISSIIRTDDKKLVILETNGILVVHFDAVGNIISKKFIGKEQFDGSGYVSYERVYYANGNICIIGKPSHPYFIEITLDGELIKKNPFSYYDTDILKKYKDRNHVNLNIRISDKKEVYVYGGACQTSGGGMGGGMDTNTYSMYFAKYDENMKLLYEKEWKVKEGQNSFIRNMLVKDGYIYMSCKIHPLVGIDEYTQHTLYIAKFKEPGNLSIPEPAIIKNYSLFPNPAGDDCTLSMDMTEAGSISISLSDMLGRDIMQIYDGYADAGAFSKAFNTKHLANGVYSVVIRIGDKAKAEKLIINR